MTINRWRPFLIVVVVALLLGVGWGVLARTGAPVASGSPSATASPAATVAAAPSGTPNATATPTPEPEQTFPLAVVTGFTNLKAETTLAELKQLNAQSQLLVPCGVRGYLDTKVTGGGDCLSVDDIKARLEKQPKSIALLFVGDVEPKTKVLPVDGADLFGNPDARAEKYPVTGSGVGLPEDEVGYDESKITSLISLGDSCPDRGVAYQAITLKKGWDWVMGGGTAKYLRVYPNPVPPGVVGNGYNIVDAKPTGNAGAVARLVSGADITVDDFECPVVDNWRVNNGVVFSIDPRAVTALRRTLGVDVATLAANHLSDQGRAGLLSTLDKFEANGIRHAGAGKDLDAALEPAYLDVRGLRLAFVGFNDVPGVQAAAPGVPGVAWLTQQNVQTAVKRARDGGANLVFCMPQWWGPGEYFGYFSDLQLSQRKIMYDAGCDHILGAGSHWAGPMALARDGSGELHFTMASHGNFLFGQSWSQETQEGVIVQLAFRGTELVQVRMHPYIMLLQAQANLIDPQTDGHYVLQRVFDSSELAY